MLLLANCEEWESDDVVGISVKMLESSNDYASSIVAEAMIRSGSLKGSETRYSLLPRSCLEHFASRKG